MICIHSVRPSLRYARLNYIVRPVWRPSHGQTCRRQVHRRYGGYPLHPLWRPAVFTLMVGGVSYSLAGIYYVERGLYRKELFKRLKNDNPLVKLWRWIEEIGPQNRFIMGVVGINVLVFLGWKRGIHRMADYFLSSVSNKGLHHLVLCNFSHIEAWHLAINMVAFSSFAGALMNVLNDKYSSAKSTAFLITAGTFSAMVGYYSRRFRGHYAQGALGASGMLYAVATLVILSFPDSTLSIVFLPFIPINATVGLSSLVALDIMGLIRGWKVFDHAGHLGGALFGILYYQWLHKVYEPIYRRSAVMWARFIRAMK